MKAFCGSYSAHMVFVRPMITVGRLTDLTSPRIRQEVGYQCQLDSFLLRFFRIHSLSRTHLFNGLFLPPQVWQIVSLLINSLVKHEHLQVAHYVRPVGLTTIIIVLVGIILHLQKVSCSTTKRDAPWHSLSPVPSFVFPFTKLPNVRYRVIPRVFRYC